MRKNADLIGIVGGVLGSLAGLIELTIGKQILPWIGNKESPVVLGLITFFLSAVALFAILSNRNLNHPNNNKKLAIFLGILFPAVICFTTVGRLWYLPGLLLLISAFLFAYNNWFTQSQAKSSGLRSMRNPGYRLLGGAGSLIILASIGMAFINNRFGLFRAEMIEKAEKILVSVLPMDIVRRTYLSGNVTAVEDIEVRLVMIVYLLLIIGAALTFIACLSDSRLFTRIGGAIVLLGYVLFPIWLPRFFRIPELETEVLRFSVGSLGWGWYFLTIGMILIITASFFRLWQDR